MMKSNIGMHLTHCYQGMFAHSCKYGEEDCPARPAEAVVQVEPWKADSARGHDGSIGVVVRGPEIQVYVDLLTDGRARVFVGGESWIDKLFETVLPSPPPFEDHEDGGGRLSEPPVSAEALRDEIAHVIVDAYCGRGHFDEAVIADDDLEVAAAVIALFKEKGLMR